MSRLVISSPGYAPPKAPNLSLSPAKDVNNVIECHKSQQKAGGTSVAYAKRRLLQDGAHVRTREDGSDPDRVVDIFWAFPQSLYYFSLYPNILIVDYAQPRPGGNWQATPSPRLLTRTGTRQEETTK